MVWMPSSKVPSFLIEEFETENEATQSTSQAQVHAANPEEPPRKVQKHEHVQEW